MMKMGKWWGIIGIIILSSVVGISIAFFYHQSTSESKIMFNQIKEIKPHNEQQRDGDYMADIQNESLEKIIYVNPIDCIVNTFSDYDILKVANYGKDSELINLTIYIFEEKNNTNRPYIEISMHSPSWSERSTNTKDIIYKNKKIIAANINNNKIILGEYNNTNTNDIQYTAIMQFHDIDYYLISYKKLEKNSFVEFVMEWSTYLQN